MNHLILFNLLYSNFFSNFRLDCFWVDEQGGVEATLCGRGADEGKELYMKIPTWSDSPESPLPLFEMSISLVNHSSLIKQKLNLTSEKFNVADSNDRNRFFANVELAVEDLFRFHEGALDVDADSLEKNSFIIKDAMLTQRSLNFGVGLIEDTLLDLRNRGQLNYPKQSIALCANVLRLTPAVTKNDLIWADVFYDDLKKNKIFSWAVRYLELVLANPDDKPSERTLNVGHVFLDWGGDYAESDNLLVCCLAEMFRVGANHMKEMEEHLQLESRMLGLFPQDEGMILQQLASDVIEIITVLHELF